MPARQFDLLAVVSLFLICTATVWAEPVSDTDVPSLDAAIATDTPTTPTPDPKVVAQEILRLQEEMGGSIVSRLEPNPQWHSPPTPPPAVQPWRPVVSSPIVALRETAWQLDQSAYALESLDLYEQADSLRNTADRLRRNARELKVQSTAVKAE